MGKLIYLAQTSLDGCVADAKGNFDWAAPDEDVHRFVNDLLRSTGTFVLGRKMYEAIRAWEDPTIADGLPGYIADFRQIWLAADKIVYSRSLREPTTARTKIERDFDPAAIERLKSSDARDMSIGGPELVSLAMRAGLLDELHMIVVPYVAGGGNHALREGPRREFELIGERRFAKGAVYLGYRALQVGT